MTRRALLALVGAALAGLLAACGGSTTGATEGDEIDAFAGRLAASGLSVTRAGSVEQPFFTGRATVLAAGADQIQVFVFDSEGAAAAAAATVTPNGSGVGTSLLTWVAPPHFYRSGRLIALYVGSNASVLSALTQVAGAQFAGR